MEKSEANLILKTTVGYEKVNPTDIFMGPNPELSDLILREAHLNQTLSPPNTNNKKPNSEGPGHLTEVSSDSHPTLTQQAQSSPVLETSSPRQLCKWKKRARIGDLIPLPNF